MDKSRVAATPTGYHAVTPYITVKDIGRTVDFYRKAFGAVERMRLELPDTKRVVHAEVTIGNSIVMLGDESHERNSLAPASLKATTGSLYVYVPDVDAAFKRATEAGCKVTMPVADMFWGDRVGEVEDPSGHHWDLATHKEDLSNEEVTRRGQAWFSSHGGKTESGKAKSFA